MSNLQPDTSQPEAQGKLHSKVKIYDRPERARPPLVFIVLLVCVVAVVGYFLYRALHPAAPARQSRSVSGAVRQGRLLQTGASVYLKSNLTLWIA